MTNPIDAAQAPGTFDVLSFIEGTSYPTSEVTLYMDVAAADRLLRANAERLKLDDGKSKDKGAYEKLDTEIAELSERVKASAMTFALRGMPPGLVQDIYGTVSEDAAPEDTRHAESKLVAATISGVTNAAGASDPRVWDADAVDKLRRYVKEGEYARLVEGVVQVNFNATLFDQATDAGFLGGSSDVAE